MINEIETNEGVNLILMRDFNAVFIKELDKSEKSTTQSEISQLLLSTPLTF